MDETRSEVGVAITSVRLSIVPVDSEPATVGRGEGGGVVSGDSSTDSLVVEVDDVVWVGVAMMMAEEVIVDGARGVAVAAKSLVKCANALALSKTEV